MLGLLFELVFLASQFLDIVDDVAAAAVVVSFVFRMQLCDFSINHASRLADV